MSYKADRLLDKIDVTIDGNTFPVETLFLGNRHNPKHIVGVSNGFALGAVNYERSLQRLYISGILDKNDYLLAMPSINAIPILDSNGRKYKNNSLQANSELFYHTLASINEQFETLLFHSVVFNGGHSTGAGVSQKLGTKKTVLINPLMSVDYGTIGFMLRGGLVALNEFKNKGSSYARGFRIDDSLPYMKNFLGNIWNNLGLITSFSDLKNSDIYGGKKDVDALLLYGGQDGKDEFFIYQPSDLVTLFNRLFSIEIFGSHNKFVYDVDPFLLPINLFLRDEYDSLEELVRKQPFTK